MIPAVERRDIEIGRYRNTEESKMGLKSNVFEKFFERNFGLAED